MKKILLLMFVLMLPLVSAESYWFQSYCSDECKDYYMEVYGKNTNNISYNCLKQIHNIPYKYYKNLRLIRVWDNHQKEGQPAGLYFLSNIIHIYDGCRNPNTLIHELSHLDRQSIKHDSFFWLSYYRIKMESYNEI